MKLSPSNKLSLTELFLHMVFSLGGGGGGGGGRGLFPKPDDGFVT